MNATIIDGSFLEGGGQILRLSAALSAILGVPIQVENVRKGRSKPGLRPQHLTGLKLVAQMCDAAVEGLEVGSTQVMISPGLLRWQKDPFSADAKTAGSCMLLAQVSLPPAMYLGFSSPQRHDSAEESPRKRPKSPRTAVLQLRGGTDASFAPPVGYMQHVFLPLMAKLQGLEVNVQTHRRGFAPKGGGHVAVEVPVLPAGACLPPFYLCDRGPIESVAIFSFSGGKESPDTAEAIAAGAQAVLEAEAGLANVQIICDTQHDPQALGAGSGVVVVAKSKEGALLGASCLGGPRHRSPATTGRIAAQDLLREVAHGGCLDTWMQDQVIIFMALARGRSAYTTGNLTLHSITAITVVESLTPARFKLRCNGRELQGDGIRVLGEELVAEGDGQGDYGTSMRARPLDNLWTVECVSPGIEKRA